MKAGENMMVAAVSKPVAGGNRQKKLLEQALSGQTASSPPLTIQSRS